MTVFCIVITCIGSISIAGDEEGWDGCPVGEMFDCNGNCAPFAWLQDDTCDNGVREWPEGSGIFIDFSCENYFCDVFNCDGCDSSCPAGEVPDCNSNCFPVGWIGDGICDLGQRTWNGNAIDLSCDDRYACDMQDCPGVCWNDGGNTGLGTLGSCCIEGNCTEITQYDCWSNVGIWMGSLTSCQTNTCGCGEGWTADCNGNCIPLDIAGGQWCADGQTFDFGDGEITIDLNCLELACAMSNCVGVCPGACCTGGDCISVSYDDCLDYGGVFLGSASLCSDDPENSGGCGDQQTAPIQLPESILAWSGALGEVSDMPLSISTGGDILVSAARYENSTGALCIFRWDTDRWAEEALLLTPDEHHPVRLCTATDGQRIAMTTETGWGSEAYHREIRIYNFDGSDWYLEQTMVGSTPIDYETTPMSSLDIDGDILVVGDTSYGYDPDENYGCARVYRFNGKSWIEDSTPLTYFGSTQGPPGHDQQLGRAVALSEGTVAVASTRSVYLFDVSTQKSTPLQHLQLNGDWPTPGSLALEGDRLVTPVEYYDWGTDDLGAQIFEFDGSEWVVAGVLTPFDITGSDWAGYIIDLEGDRILITSPRDSDLGVSTGSAYIWDYNGSEWVFSAKLWSDRAAGGQEFGSMASLHGGKAYIAEHQQHEDKEGIRVFGERGIAWVNPDGGAISSEENWDPQAPVAGDTASFSLRSQTTILVDHDPPFDQFIVGPGTPIFDLDGFTRTMGSGEGNTLKLAGVAGLPASLGITNGTLIVEGDVRLGYYENAAKLFVTDSLIIDGLFKQTDAGELQVELEVGRPAPVQLTGTAPQLAGVLSLTIADNYIPQDGDVIPVITTEFIDGDNTGDWKCVVVKDPLPEGLYMKIIYAYDPEVGVYWLGAEVDSLENFFGYGDPNSASIAGNATDVAVADLGTSSSARGGVDGFDDIVAITEDGLYVFMSDGTGGIATQYMFNNPGFVDLSSVDIGDIDGDGITDIVVTSAENNTVIPIFNVTNDPTSLVVGEAASTASNPSSVLLIDLDATIGDEIAVACAGNSVTDGQIDFFAISVGARSILTPLGSMETPGNPSDMSSSLSPKDDEDDWITFTLSDSKKVGKGSGESSSALTWSFELESVTSIGVSPTRLSVGDLNGDGIEDVVTTSPESDVVSVLTGNADGTLSSALLINVGNLPRSIALLDYDRDGDLDIAVIATSEVSNNRAVFVYRNDTSLNGGNLLFAVDMSLDEGLSPILVAKGDIDGDGGDDLISINTVSSFRGAGNQLRVRKIDDILCDADLDNDSVVAVNDLLMLIAAWGQPGTQPADLDGNQTVDVLDLLILIAAWGPCS